MRTSLPRMVARLGAVAMVVVSGVYLLLYLYRWEWNRAMVAGVFFLAAEIAVVGMALADRVSAAPRAPDPRPVTRDAGAPAPATPRFPWLDPGRMSVFVPVLLGAGVLLSLVAWLVERIARATSPGGPSPLLDRVGDDHSDAPLLAGRRPGSLLLRVAVLAALAVALTIGLQAFADLAQSRNHPPSPGRTLLVEVEIRTRGATDPVPVLAERLALYCVPAEFEHDVRMVGEDVARVAVWPAPGRTDRRMIHGCLEDLIVSRTLAAVVDEVEVDDDQVVSAPGPGGTVHS